MSLSQYLSFMRQRPVTVELRCSCSLDSSIYEQYLCLECNLLCCPKCTVVEVDSQFCPVSQEQVIYGGNVLAQRGRSADYAECPLCFCTLAVQQRDGPTGKFGFFCEFCRWSSPWTNPQGKAMNADLRMRLQDSNDAAARFAALRSQAEIDLVPWVDRSEEKDDDEDEAPRISKDSSQGVMKAVEILERGLESKERAAATEKPENRVDNSAAAPLAPSWFADGVLDLERVSTLEQRLACLETQPLEAAQLLPQPTRLESRLAHRCPKCKKHVLKPTPTQKLVGFEKKNLASDSLPLIEVSPVPSLVPGVTVPVIIYLSNPVVCPVRLTLVPAQVLAERESEAGIDHGDAPVGAGQLGLRESEVIEEDSDLAPKWAIPTEEIMLSGHLDEEERRIQTDSGLLPTDSPAIIALREHHRVGIKATVTPRVVGAPVRVRLVMAVRAEEPKSAYFDTLRVLVTINLGPADSPPSQTSPTARS